MMRCRDAIDGALERLRGDGTIDRIYGRYGIVLQAPKLASVSGGSKRLRSAIATAVRPDGQTAHSCRYAAAFFRACSALYSSNSSAIALATEGAVRRRS